MSILIGDQVRVFFPAGGQFDDPAKKFHNQEFIVKSRRPIRKPRSSNCEMLYELYGCKTKYGIHYVFLEDTLIRIE